MKPAFEVIVCGSLHLDIVVHARALPRVDETAVGTAWHQVCGGKGGNQAVQSARAGAQTAMIGCIGQDEFGKTLKANLIAENVDVSGLAITPSAGSGMSVAILQDNGDYGAVIVSGSNLLIDATNLQNQWNKLGGAKIVVLQNEVPDTVNVAIAKAARAAEAQVIINAAPARELSQDLLDMIDILIVNRVEAEAMCGHSVSSSVEARQALTKLKSLSRAVIMTLGGDGLIVATKTGEIFEIDPVPVKVSSTHGAGDCFVGTLSAELAKGKTLVEACRTANHAAAAFVSRPSNL
jgi:ribokinase